VIQTVDPDPANPPSCLDLLSGQQSFGLEAAMRSLPSLIPTVKLQANLFPPQPEAAVVLNR
jgi:hypothetical protein